MMLIRVWAKNFFQKTLHTSKNKTSGVYNLGKQKTDA